MLILFPLLCLLMAVLGVDVPITLDGGLVDATADDDTYNTGGTISLNGWTVKVPKNMLVTFPAAFVPWKDFVAQKASFIGFETNVVGNIVDGQNIAGQIIISEFALEINQGHIEEINFDGTMKIHNGPTIRINDPNAVFSAGFSSPFMVSDDKSPSVSSFSGFPMCVPRSANDTLCPASNRPLLAGSNAPRRVFQAPNPMLMAPFLPGDFIQYKGFRAPNNVLICYEIVAWNVQITTVGKPTYIRGELALLGIYSPDTSTEVADTRFIGYTSDPTVTVSITAIDIDPCTGEETERSIGVGQERPEAGGRNKWLARLDGTAPTTYTREYRFAASLGTQETTNGIVSGEYIMPVLEWIQPEQLVPGVEPPVNQFAAMSHLTRGVGPDEDGNIWGPLQPFPQSGVTVFNISTCTPTGPGTGGGGEEGDPETPAPRIQATIPIAPSGGQTATVSNPNVLFARSDDTFTLRGFQDNNSPVFTNDTLTWTWSVVAAESAGTQSNLQTFTPSSDGKSITVRFANSAPTGEYKFQLSVSSASQETMGTATFTVNFFTGPDIVTVETVTWTSSQSGTFGAVCKSNYLVDWKVSMQVTYPADGGATTSAMAAAPPGSGSWSFSARRVARPGTVTCRSALNGQGTRTGTTAKRSVEEHFRYSR
ncbi:hypothetical protein QBC35DRAFT_526074 [Podospora australis]|uniref:Uncharacterized protein n=1 Tax=Podospora australis TaxID=1536484 RepID=A0AAN6WLK1_9PEZI|nr:hypothetical protein QBC35DRAFT_526074 [Podospora australis]